MCTQAIDHQAAVKEVISRALSRGIIAGSADDEIASKFKKHDSDENLKKIPTAVLDNIVGMDTPGTSQPKQPPIAPIIGAAPTIQRKSKSFKPLDLSVHKPRK